MAKKLFNFARVIGLISGLILVVGCNNSQKDSSAPPSPRLGPGTPPGSDVTSGGQGGLSGGSGMNTRQDQGVQTPATSAIVAKTSLRRDKKRYATLQKQLDLVNADIDRINQDIDDIDLTLKQQQEQIVGISAGQAAIGAIGGITGTVVGATVPNARGLGNLGNQIDISPAARAIQASMTQNQTLRATYTQELTTKRQELSRLQQEIDQVEISIAENEAILEPEDEDEDDAAGDMADTDDLLDLED